MRNVLRTVANYTIALEHGIERLAELPIGIRLVKELHDHSMSEVHGRHGQPGEFRGVQDWAGPPGCRIGDATFVPSLPHELPLWFDDFEALLHDRYCGQDRRSKVDDA